MGVKELQPHEAAALVRRHDTLGVPLGPGQPPAFLAALGERDDWEDLRVVGALLLVGTELFTRPNVHFLSGFFGPFERALRDMGANIGFVPADFRRIGRVLALLHPRVVALAGSLPDANGDISLSLHAGGGIEEARRAGADPERLLIVEVSERFPRTHGLPPEYPHTIHLDEVNVLVHGEVGPLAFPEPPISEVDAAIAAHASRYIHDGSTVQTGIGAIPSAIARVLADGPGGDYGVHTEMFTDGLMHLHEAGKVTNRHKGIFDGVSVATFCMGSQDLYDWVAENPAVAFLPVEVVNAPHVISANHDMVTINGALAVDIQGQAVADTIAGDQYSGIGGAEDFAAGAGYTLDAHSLTCLPATAVVDGGLRSRIVPFFGPGAVITTPRHHVDVVVTEFGAAELTGKTVHQRGEALATIAHPDFRDELLEAAERASKGHSPVPA